MLKLLIYQNKLAIMLILEVASFINLYFVKLTIPFVCVCVCVCVCVHACVRVCVFVSKITDTFQTDTDAYK